MITCDICLKTFNRRDNMLRHRNSVHSNTEDKNESEISDTDTSMMDEEGSESDAPSSMSDYDAWDKIIEIAFDKLQPKFVEEVKTRMERENIDEVDARNKVYDDMKSVYRKAVMGNFMSRMEWFCAIQQDPIYRAIKHTAATVIEEDSFDRSEAWKYATSKRKYLIDNILSEYSPPDLTTDEENDNDSSV